MKILLVNGSPRRAAANSRIVLDALRARLGESHEYRMVDVMTAPGALPEDLEVDFIVLAFPLYIDCLHSKLLSWLLSFEAMRRARLRAAVGKRPIGMIAVANNGFHEGVQNKTALDIVASFCARCGIEWRGGVGIGTGEMLKPLKDAPNDMLLKRPVSRALDTIAARVTDEYAEGGNLYVQHALPWQLYRLMGHMGWRRQARKHGVSRRQLESRQMESRSRGA